MDYLEQYRIIVQKILAKYALHKPSHGEIETLQICDLEHDNYLLVDVGWDRTGRVHSIVTHLRIVDGKIWIEWDGTEQGITQDLLNAGVLQENIVLGFYRPERRVIAEFF